MNGITSLMQGPQQGPMPGQAPPQQMPGMMPQQGPMPGQAPPQQMPGMLPQQGAPTPGAMTGSLKSMPLDQLKMMYMNPQPNSPPLWAVISALAEKQKEAQAMQMAQGQQAMAQNAQMQQQPPVAAQVMQAAEQMGEPVMAAYGGLMQGYAGGGAVAFRHGGGVQHFRDGADEFGLMANPEAEAMDALRVERAQKENALRVEREQKENQLKALEETYYSLRMQNDPRAAQVKQQLDALYGRAPMSSPAASSAPTRQGKSGIADLDIGPSMAPLQRTGASAVAQQSAPSRGIPTVMPSAAPQGEMSPEERKTYADYRAMMEGRKVRPESLVKAEQGLGELAQANITAQRAESERMAREAQERRDAAIGRSQRSILSDPQSLLALAGSIDTRRGQGIGSLARGAAGLMGQREASAEAARKEYATAQQAQRAMDAAIRQTQMLEAQRQVAVETGKYDLVNQLDEKIAQSKMAEQTAARDVRNKSIEQARLERVATAQEVEAGAKATTAGRPTETTRLLQELNLAPTLENLGALAGARQPAVAGERQDVNELRALITSLRDQADPMKNFDKPSREQAASMLKRAQEKLAQMSGLDRAASAGSQAPPPVGTVMQGYRFKGGNPADRNNWEKV